MESNLAKLTMKELVERINLEGVETLENGFSMQNLNKHVDDRHTLTHMIQYIFHGVQIYLNRRRQIFLHLGKDELNKTQVVDFNVKYFKQD